MLSSPLTNSIISYCSRWLIIAPPTRILYNYIYIYMFFKMVIAPPTRILYIYTLWLINIAMENGPLIDGLPIKNDDFPWLC